MSANVISMLTYRRETPSAEQQARDQVTDQLRDKVTSTILAQAKARAVRSVIGGRPVRDAVRTSVAWALYTIHDDELPPVA
jgi:hypothetical protein